MRPILIHVLLIILASLAAKDHQVSNLYVTDSLPARGEEYAFTFPVTLNVIERKLYILDQRSNMINVFDSDNLTFIRRFGGYGSDPGSFNRALSIESDGWDNIAITDYNNDRIQFLSPYGEFVKEIEFYFPWKFYFHSQELYVDAFPGSEYAGIYAVTDSGIYPEIDLTEYFEKNKIQSALQKYYSWCVTDWGYVLSFSTLDRIIIFNNSGKATKTKVDDMPLKYENTLYGKPHTQDDNFLLLATSNDHAADDSTQTEIKYHNLIGSYDKKGNLTKIYQLPDNVWLADSWALDNNRIFLYDTKNFIVYIFDLN